MKLGCRSPWWLDHVHRWHVWGATIPGAGGTTLGWPSKPLWSAACCLVRCHHISTLRAACTHERRESGRGSSCFGLTMRRVRTACHMCELVPCQEPVELLDADWLALLAVGLLPARQAARLLVPFGPLLSYWKIGAARPGFCRIHYRCGSSEGPYYYYGP